MKKTTYIPGLTLRYSRQAIDRTGVESANAIDREAAAVLEQLDDCLRIGYDERCNLHAPDPVAYRDTMRRSGRAILAYLCVIGVILIGLTVHFAPAIDAWRWPW